jgi:hypothetical protein
MKDNLTTWKLEIAVFNCPLCLNFLVFYNHNSMGDFLLWFSQFSDRRETGHFEALISTSSKVHTYFKKCTMNSKSFENLVKTLRNRVDS